MLLGGQGIREISLEENKKVVVVQSYPVWLAQTLTWMYNQVRFLPREVENHIVCENTENLDQFSLPNIHSLSESPILRYYWDNCLRALGFRCHLGFLVKQAKVHRAQVLHSHFGNVGWVNLGAARQARLKHVVNFYGFDVNYLPKKDMRWRKRYVDLFKQVERILCEGPYMAKCIEAIGCPREKIQVQHLGVSVNEIIFKPRVWDPAEPLRVLIAASFQEKKGIPYALEALGRVQRDVQLEITIIGDANDERRSQIEKERILAVIEAHHLQRKTRMLGYQPHAVLFEEAYKHHIFLSPSITSSDGDTEGGVPVTLIEMAATGMPIVSTEHCDIGEVLETEVSGLLAPERDVDGLVNHIKCLAEHRDRWDPMVNEARRWVEAEYNSIKQGKRLASIYQEIARS